MKDIEKLKNLKHLESTTINWFEEGGAVVYRINDEFVLYEVPQYGGQEQYHETYNIKHLDILVATVMEWT